MGGPTDLTDEEVAWLARLEVALAVGIPREIEAKLLRLGLAHLAEVGLKVSPQGTRLLNDPRWAPLARSAALREWTSDLFARLDFEQARAKKLVDEARSRRTSEDGKG